MGGPKDAKKLGDDRDRDEVRSVADLEPDATPNRAQEKRAQDELLNPDVKGYFESQGASGNWLAAPLHLGPEIKQDGAPVVAQYEAGYNTYSKSLRSTYQSMGRLKDLSETGAPLTVKDLARRPDLMRAFRPLSQHATDEGAQARFYNWSARQTKLKFDTQKINAVQRQLAAALASYRGMQQQLAQKRAEAEKAEKTEELKKIDEASETLAKIVEVTYESWHAVGEIEEQMEKSAAFDEHAEGPGDTSSLPSGTTPDWTDDPTKPKKAGPTLGQKGARTAAALGEGGQHAAAIARLVNEHLNKNNVFQLSLEDLITATTHGKEVINLRNEITKLEGEIKLLELGQWAQEVYAADQQLTGMQITISVARQEAEADRTIARRDAKLFGQHMAKNDQGAMVTYAAEAYQELEGFGTLADEQRQALVEPVYKGARYYLDNLSYQRAQVKYFVSDAYALRDNLDEFVGQRATLREQLPQWKQAAADWRAFFKQETGSDLIVKTTPEQ